MTALVVAVLILEVIIAFRLWREYRALQAEIALQRSKCYACITGASAESFSDDVHLCLHHRAHWWLVRDLEDQVRPR